jgi:hypothetical protein
MSICSKHFPETSRNNMETNLHVSDKIYHQIIPLFCLPRKCEVSVFHCTNIQNQEFKFRSMNNRYTCSLKCTALQHPIGQSDRHRDITDNNISALCIAHGTIWYSRSL